MNDSNSDLGAMYTDKYGLTHYWGRMQGTSMSSPFAAGVFALWLEANPTLDVNAIRDIAKRTAMTDRYTQAGDPVQWGAGKLDAYEGLKLALNYTSSVNDVLADKSIIYQEVSPVYMMCLHRVPASSMPHSTASAVCRQLRQAQTVTILPSVRKVSQPEYMFSVSTPTVILRHTK